MTLKDLYKKAKESNNNRIGEFYNNLLVSLIALIILGVWILVLNIIWNSLSHSLNLPILNYSQTIRILFLGLIIKNLYKQITIK
jgi:hypothetical protein